VSAVDLPAFAALRRRGFFDDQTRVVTLAPALQLRDIAPSFDTETTQRDAKKVGPLP
jgi:hypothetical protein